MQFNLKNLPESAVEIEMAIEPNEMRPYLERAADDLTKQKPIEGFRAGKAPYDLVKKTLGEHAIYERALGFALNSFLSQVIAEKKLHIVGNPEISVKKLAPGNSIELTIKTAIVPELDLPDFESIATKILKSKTAPEVTNKEIDDAIQWLRESRSVKKEVTRPAQKGDSVEINFSAKDNGIDIAGGPSENHPLVIGQGSMVPGFEDHLIGMIGGEKKEFSLHIPEAHPEKGIAGKTLDFDVTMNKTEERILPDLTDSFAQNLGNFPTVETLRNNIKEGIAEEKALKERDRIRVSILDAIAEKISVTLPPILIERELDKMVAELRESIESMRMKYEDYLTHIKKTEPDLKKEWAGDAERRVKIALILKKIAEAKHIDPTPEEVEHETKRFLDRFKTASEAEKEIDPEALRTYARGVARNEKVFRYLETLR